MRRINGLNSAQAVLDKLNQLCPFITFVNDEFEGVAVDDNGVTVSLVLGNWPQSNNQGFTRGFWIDWSSSAYTELLDQGAGSMAMSDTYVGAGSVCSCGHSDIFMMDGRSVNQTAFKHSSGAILSEDLNVALKYTNCFFNIYRVSASDYMLYFELLHLASALAGQTGFHVTMPANSRKALVQATSGPGVYGVYDPAPYSPDDFGSDEIILLLEDGWMQANGIAVNAKPVQSEFGFSFAGATLYEDGVASEIDDQGKLKLALNVGVGGLLPQPYDYPCYLSDRMQVDVDGESETTVLLKDEQGHPYAFPLNATQALQEKLAGSGLRPEDFDLRLIVNTPANASITNKPVKDLIADGTLSGPFADLLKGMLTE